MTWLSFGTLKAAPPTGQNTEFRLGKGLDKGDGEFMIADRFVKNCWQNYKQSRGNSEDSATGAAEIKEA